MQVKQIYFKNRLHEFLPQFIFNLLDHHCILAGGVFRSYLNSEKIQDFDIFFLNKDRVQEVKNSLLSRRFKIIFSCHQGKFISLKKKNIKVQLITEQIFASIEEILDSFDFTVTQFASNGESLYFTKEAMIDTKKKLLRFHKITYPAATLGRFYKYIKKGYYFDEFAKKDFIYRLLTVADIVDFDRVYID